MFESSFAFTSFSGSLGDVTNGLSLVWPDFVNMSVDHMKRFELLTDPRETGT
jgi:hypothetical protein